MIDYYSIACPHKTTHSPLLNKLCGILEVSSNVLYQPGLLLLTQHLAPKCAHLGEVVVISCVVTLHITSHLGGR